MDYQVSRGTAVQQAILRVRITGELSVGRHETEVGREPLPLMIDEPSERPPKDSTRALLPAAGVEGPLARRAMRAERAELREPRQLLRQQVGEKLEYETRLIETPERRLTASVEPTGVGKTTTLAKLLERAVLSFNGACAWSA
jgi:hypothetical protein